MHFIFITLLSVKAHLVLIHFLAHVSYGMVCYHFRGHASGKWRAHEVTNLGGRFLKAKGCVRKCSGARCVCLQLRLVTGETRWVGASERASARSSQSDRRQAPAEAAQLVKHTHNQSERDWLPANLEPQSDKKEPGGQEAVF